VQFLGLLWKVSPLRRTVETNKARNHEFRGYATKIFRSGEADTLIDAFLNPAPKLDTNKCQDCRGSGGVYIDSSNQDKGVKPCKHERLKVSLD